jgi:hypothetical protein
MIIFDEAIEAKYESGENLLSSSIERLKISYLEGSLRSSSVWKLASSPKRKPWNTKKKSRLIESFLTNIPVNPLIGIKGSDEVVEIIDGRERLKAIAEFYNNQFALSGLELWSEFNGLTYREISSVRRTRLDRRYIALILIEPMGEANPDQFQKLVDLTVRRLNS